jgi:hypothetical protein
MLIAEPDDTSAMEVAAVPSSTGRSNSVLYIAVQNIANGTKRTCRDSLTMSALEGRTDVPFKLSHFRL